MEKLKKFHEMIQNGEKEEKISLLLQESPLLIDALGQDGNGAIHIAAKKGNRKIVSLLLQNGANVSLLKPLPVDPPTRMKALYPHSASAPEQLSFSQGEVIVVREKWINSGWWVGVNKDGVKGTFPVNYFEEIGPVSSSSSSSSSDLDSFSVPSPFSATEDIRIIEVKGSKGPPCNGIYKREAYTRGERACFSRLGGGCIYFDGFFWKIFPVGDAVFCVDWCFSQSHSTSSSSSSSSLFPPLGRWVEERKIGGEMMQDYSELVVEKKEGGVSPLLMAASEGYIDVVRLLLSKGADPNTLDPRGVSVLEVAIARNRVGVAQILIHSAPNLNYFDLEGKTALHFAVFFDQLQIVKLLLENSANPNIQSNTGLTPLHTASQKSLFLSQLLLDHGANPNLTEMGGETPLFGAIRSGNSGIVQCLVRRGVDVNIVANRFSPFLVAVLSGNLKVTQILVEANANINFKGPEGKTGLHLACQEKKYEIIQYLATLSSLDPNIKDDKGNPALVYALSDGFSLQNILKITSLNVNFDYEGKPLILSVPDHFVESFLEHEADPNIQVNQYFMGHESDPNIQVSVVEPILFGATTKVSLALIEHGADINYQNKEGYSPILYTLINLVDCEDKVNLLILAGCDLSVRTRPGVTVLDASSNPLIQKLCKKAPIDANPIDSKGLARFYKDYLLKKEGEFRQFKFMEELILACRTGELKIDSPQFDNWNCWYFPWKLLSEKLKIIDLRNCSLSVLPFEISLCEKLQKIELSGNPLGRFYRQLEGATPQEVRKCLMEMLTEDQEIESRSAPLIFLGESGAGKSVLFQKIREGGGKGKGKGKGKGEEEGEEGAKRKRNQVQMSEMDLGDFHFSCIDFIGDHFVLSSHQVFFSDRSVCLVVFDVRLELKMLLSQVEFWLRGCHTRTKDSLPILVGTHCDEISVEAGTEKCQTIFEKMAAYKPEEWILVDSVSQKNVAQLKELIVNLGKRLQIKIPTILDYVSFHLQVLEEELEQIQAVKLVDDSVAYNYIHLDPPGDNVSDKLKMRKFRNKKVTCLKRLDSMGRLKMVHWPFFNEKGKALRSHAILLNPKWCADIISRFVFFVNKQYELSPENLALIVERKTSLSGLLFILQSLELVQKLDDKRLLVPYYLPPDPLPQQYNWESHKILRAYLFTEVIEDKMGKIVSLPLLIGENVFISKRGSVAFLDGVEMCVRRESPSFILDSGTKKTFQSKETTIRDILVIGVNKDTPRALDIFQRLEISVTQTLALFYGLTFENVIPTSVECVDWVPLKSAVSAVLDNTQTLQTTRENSVSLRSLCPDLIMKNSSLPLIDAAEVKMSRLLGKGGFGEVYLAEWKMEKVVVKKSIENSSTSEVENFMSARQEAYLMNAMDHPNIVKFVGISLIENHLSLFLEYMAGGDLSDLAWDPLGLADAIRLFLGPHFAPSEATEKIIQVLESTKEKLSTSLPKIVVEQSLSSLNDLVCFRGKKGPKPKIKKFKQDIQAVQDMSSPLSDPIFFRIAFDILWGVHHLHTLSPPMIHRDLKSQNILLIPKKEELDEEYAINNIVAKIADFGLTKIGEVQLKEQDSDLEPRFLAPEVIQRSGYSFESDIYAIGLILYEMRYRKQFLDYLGKLEFVGRLVAGERPPLTYHDEIDSIIEDCWASNISRRPSLSSLFLRLSRSAESKGLADLLNNIPPLPHSSVNGEEEGERALWRYKGAMKLKKMFSSFEKICLGGSVVWFVGSDGRVGVFNICLGGKGERKREKVNICYLPQTLFSSSHKVTCLSYFEEKNLIFIATESGLCQFWFAKMLPKEFILSSFSFKKKIQLQKEGKLFDCDVHLWQMVLNLVFSIGRKTIVQEIKIEELDGVDVKGKEITLRGKLGVLVQLVENTAADAQAWKRALSFILESLERDIGESAPFLLREMVVGDERDPVICAKELGNSAIRYSCLTRSGGIYSIGYISEEKSSWFETTSALNSGKSVLDLLKPFDMIDVGISQGVANCNVLSFPSASHLSVNLEKEREIICAVSIRREEERVVEVWCSDNFGGICICSFDKDNFTWKSRVDLVWQDGREERDLRGKEDFKRKKEKTKKVVFEKNDVINDCLVEWAVNRKKGAVCAMSVVEDQVLCGTTGDEERAPLFFQISVPKRTIISPPHEMKHHKKDITQICHSLDKLTIHSLDGVITSWEKEEKREKSKGKREK